MKMKLTLVILGVCLLGQGCGPITLATRTLVIEPIHYCFITDNIVEMHRNYKLAEESWESIINTAPGHNYSLDYAEGFKEGFADFLYAGGTGEPPPLPPRNYWRSNYETPQGHQAIEDWFDGYRHGAAMAQQSGYRQWVTIPSSVPPRVASSQIPSSVTPESIGVPPSEPVLPQPRKIVPPQAPNKDHTGGGRPADTSAPSVPGKDSPGNSRADLPARVGLPPDFGHPAATAPGKDSPGNSRADPPVRVVLPRD
jgi:hypothetical protein